MVSVLAFYFDGPKVRIPLTPTVCSIKFVFEMNEINKKGPGFTHFKWIEVDFFLYRAISGGDQRLNRRRCSLWALESTTELLSKNVNPGSPPLVMDGHSCSRDWEFKSHRTILPRWKILHFKWSSPGYFSFIFILFKHLAESNCRFQAGSELGSLESKISTLNTWPPPRPIPWYCTTLKKQKSGKESGVDPVGIIWILYKSTLVSFRSFQNF